MKNIEKMMKFCSTLNEVFKYPYFFNWSTPTNHYDDTPEGEIRDVNYVIFRVGMYPPLKEEVIDGVVYEMGGQQFPIEKQLFFGQTCRITDFTPFNELLINQEKKYDSENIIKSFQDLEKNKEKLKTIITKFLQ